MSTISNERLEEIAEEDFGSDVLFESSVLARELLALRKEREKAEPVQVPEQPPERLLPKSTSVDAAYRRAGIVQGWELCRAAMLDAGALRERAEPVAYMIGGHYLMHANDPKVDNYSSAVPLYTAPPAPVAPGDWLPYDPQIAEYEQMMEAELKAAASTAHKVKSELSQMAEKLLRDTTALSETLSAETDTTAQQFELLVGKAVSGWIPCSKRLPPEKTGVLVATEFDGPGDWRMKWGTRVPGHPDAKNGWFIPGASWDPSYWQPLPEPPCK